MTHAETCCKSIRGANRHNALQNEVIRQVQEYGGFARAAGLTMYVPPVCDRENAPDCPGCEECDKENGIRVDVELGGLGGDGSYAVDVANVEIRTENARYSENRPVSTPLVAVEKRKRSKYKELCRAARDLEFIPAVMSSFSAPGNGMNKLVTVLAERLHWIEGGDLANCKRKVLRRFQVVAMREIAVNGKRAMHEHRREIFKVRQQQSAAPQPLQDLAARVNSLVQWAEQI